MQEAVTVTTPSTRPAPIPVCERCRRRKQRCETSSLRPCEGCIKANVECMIEDPESGTCTPRTYILKLEEQARTLRAKLEERRKIGSRQGLTPIPAVQPAGATRARSRDPASRDFTSTRYLGASSGMAFIEAAIHLARIRGILNDADEIDSVSEKPAMDSVLLGNMLVPPVLTPLPPKDQMKSMYLHFSTVQWQYQILREDEYYQYLEQYHASLPTPDPISTVTVFMVFAISLHVLGKRDGSIAAANGAESYHEQALSRLGPLFRKKSLQNLQAILLILLYSIVNPQKPIVWHLLGSALRLASSLRLYKDGIEFSEQDMSADLPRRLFWSLYSMDRAVGNTLGRPTALQDWVITANLPGLASHETNKVTNHCFRIRQLQSEVADSLYQRIRPVDVAHYIPDVQSRLDAWRADIPRKEPGCGEEYITDWFEHAYHNLCMFIHRPSPANPHPGTEDLRKCFEAASEVIRRYACLLSSGSIYTTWMAVHWLFLAAVTHLFCLWMDPGLRHVARWNTVNEDIQATLMILAAMTERWRSSKRMLDIYRRLSRGTLTKFVSLSLARSAAEEYTGDGDGFNHEMTGFIP